jgi:hypothetical protein
MHEAPTPFDNQRPFLLRNKSEPSRSVLLTHSGCGYMFAAIMAAEVGFGEPFCEAQLP